MSPQWQGRGWGPVLGERGLGGRSQGTGWQVKAPSKNSGVPPLPRDGRDRQERDRQGLYGLGQTEVHRARMLRQGRTGTGWARDRQIWDPERQGWAGRAPRTDQSWDGGEVVPHTPKRV